VPVLVEAAEVLPDGLDGDHAPEGKRAVTLIQAEHLPVVAALAGRDVTPALCAATSSWRASTSPPCVGASCGWARRSSR
jgi:hypothetical protein